tara:strand:- start:2146 stop:2808 length:663 start_codon:yes stop_codon:yes gene_type:complete
MSKNTKRELSLRELIEEYNEALPTSDQELARLGISTQPKKPDCPEALKKVLKFDVNGKPDYKDLTEFSDSQLGAAFSFYTNLAAYANVLETRARCKLKTAKKKMSMVEAALKVYLRSQGVKASTLKEDLATYKSEEDNSYVWHNIMKEVDKLDTDFVQLETAHKNLRSDINNISREISRRQAIHQREARGSSINKRSFSSSNKGTSNNYNEGGGGSRWTR